MLTELKVALLVPPWLQHSVQSPSVLVLIFLYVFSPI